MTSKIFVVVALAIAFPATGYAAQVNGEYSSGQAYTRVSAADAYRNFNQQGAQMDCQTADGYGLSQICPPPPGCPACQDYGCGQCYKGTFDANSPTYVNCFNGGSNVRGTCCRGGDLVCCQAGAQPSMCAGK